MAILAVIILSLLEGEEFPMWTKWLPLAFIVLVSVPVLAFSLCG